MHAVCESTAPFGQAAERRRVDDERAVGGSTTRSRSSGGRRRGTPRTLVRPGASSVSWWIQRASVVTFGAPVHRRRRPLPPARRRPGREVVDHERELVGGLPPVRGAEHRAELRRRAAARAPGTSSGRATARGRRRDAGVRERVGEPVHAVVELGVRQPTLAVDRGECRGRLRGAREQVAERQVMEIDIGLAVPSLQ